MYKYFHVNERLEPVGMKVLVTGSTGFIGRHVITELLKYDCEIIATATSEEKAKRFDWYKKITFIRHCRKIQ